MITAIIVLGTVAGCPRQPAANSTAPLGDSLSRSQVYVDSATTSVKAATPHADATGRVHLATASENLSAATGELAKAQAQTALLNKAIGDLKTQNVQQQARIDAYSKRWIGDRMFSTMRWLIATAIIVAVGLGVLKAFAASNPIAAVVYHILSGLATGGLSFVHLAASTVATKVVSKP